MTLPPEAGGSVVVILVGGNPPSIERLAAAETLNPEPTAPLEFLNIFRGEEGEEGGVSPAENVGSPSANSLCSCSVEVSPEPSSSCM